MHEFGIAQRILEISQKELESRAVTAPVERVVLSVGRLRAIVPDSLTFHFDIIKTEMPQFRAAALAIREIPIKVNCGECRSSFELQEMSFFCEKCGHPLTVSSGEELSIDSIDVSD